MFLFAALGAGVGQAHAESGQSQVPMFVLPSCRQEYPWTRGQRHGFIAALDADKGRAYDVRGEYLETKRVGYGADSARLTAAHLRVKYAGYRPAESKLPTTTPCPSPLQQPEIVVIGDAGETHRAIEHEVRAESNLHPGMQATYLSCNRLDNLVGEMNKARAFRLSHQAGGGCRCPGTHPEPAGSTRRDCQERRFHRPQHGKCLSPAWSAGRPVHQWAAAELLRHHLDGVALGALPLIEESSNEYVFDDLEPERSRLTLPPELDRRALHLNVKPGFYAANRSIVLGAHAQDSRPG